MPIPRVNPDPLFNPTRLDELLLYRLSVITRGSSLPMVRLFEGELGITRRHWHVLALLVEHGALRPSEIAARCWLDRPQVSRALAGLREQELLQRGTLAQASAKGHAVYSQALARVSRFNQQLVAVLQADERLVLDGMLARLQARAQTLAAQTAEAVPPVRRSKGGRSSRRL